MTDSKRPLHLAGALVVLCGLHAGARADVFAFTDADGFERCLRTDHVIETITTGSGSQARYLDDAEVQLRCIDSAARMLAPRKLPDLDLAFLAISKRLSAVANALPIVSVLVDHALASCDDLPAYEVIMDGLSRMADDSASSPFGRARSIAKRCLKDKAFQADLREEQGHPDADRSANACQILLEEKLVKSCKARS